LANSSSSNSFFCSGFVSNLALAAVFKGGVSPKISSSFSLK
jgi:hypothetical protein